jgi:hypothetical protein
MAGRTVTVIKDGAREFQYTLTDMEELGARDAERHGEALWLAVDHLDSNSWVGPGSRMIEAVQRYHFYGHRPDKRYKEHQLEDAFKEYAYGWNVIFQSRPFFDRHMKELREKKSQPLTEEQALEIAREEMPEASDDARMWAVWNATGFPSFFVADPAEELRAQLRKYEENARSAPKREKSSALVGGPIYGK